AHLIHDFAKATLGKKFKSPSLVIIGKVVKLHQDFQWMKESLDERIFQADNRKYFKITSIRLTMLEEIKLRELNQLVEGLSRDELVWLNGYVSGLVKGKQVAQSEGAENKSSGKVTIAFGTETGNSKKLATSFAAKARKQGLSVK